MTKPIILVYSELGQTFLSGFNMPGYDVRFNHVDVAIKDNDMLIIVDPAVLYVPRISKDFNDQNVFQATCDNQGCVSTQERRSLNKTWVRHLSRNRQPYNANLEHDVIVIDIDDIQDDRPLNNLMFITGMDNKYNFINDGTGGIRERNNLPTKLIYIREPNAVTLVAIVVYKDKHKKQFDVCMIEPFGVAQVFAGLCAKSEYVGTNVKGDIITDIIDSRRVPGVETGLCG